MHRDQARAQRAKGGGGAGAWVDGLEPPKSFVYQNTLFNCVCFSDYFLMWVGGCIGPFGLARPPKDPPPPPRDA